MAAYGARLLASLIDSADGVREYCDLGLTDSIFTPNEAVVFVRVRDHFNQYGVLPSRETLKEDYNISLPVANEPSKYYFDHANNRLTHATLREMTSKVRDHLNSGSVEKALKLVEELAVSQYREANAGGLVNFTEDSLSIIKSDYHKRQSLGDAYGISTGWEYLDELMGGLIPGDYMAIVARMGQGKTFLLLHIALYIWRYFKKVPMVVTMEMKPLPIVQRLAAMYTSTNLTNLRKARLSTNKWSSVQDNLEDLHEDGVPFWVLDGNLTASVNDILMKAMQLKPDVVLIDGAYLVKPEGRYGPKWEQLAASTEQLKQRLAGGLGIPTICTYQLNKEATKLKKGQEIGTEHVAGTEVISQLASVVLALLQEESIETKLSRTISVLKGRNGEIGEFQINWLFNKYPYLDFSQLADDTRDLSFL